jgi:Icc-related predicted phosphoesterase
MTLRILQASDIHETDSKDLPKYRHIRDLANNESVDAVILNGDFFFNQEVNKVAMVQNKASNRIMGWVDSKDRRWMISGQQVRDYGGIKRLKQESESSEVNAEYKIQLDKIINSYEKNKTKIDAVEAKYANLVKFNNKLFNKELVKVKREINAAAEKRFKRLDKVLQGIKAPVYFVRGNWETDNFVDYKWKKPKLLEKEGVVDIKGVKFAGAPNWYERLGRMPDDMYQKMEREPATGYRKAICDFEEGLLSCETDQEKQEYVEHVIAQSPVFKRLGGKQFDVLVTHKGPHSLAYEQAKNKHFGSGVGLEEVIQTAQPKIILAGHIHGKGLVMRQSKDEAYPMAQNYSYQGVRSSDEVLYLMDIDTNSKEIMKNGIQPYRWQSDKVYYKAA